jgi:hypothetical protein
MGVNLRYPSKSEITHQYRGFANGFGGNVITLATEDSVRDNDGSDDASPAPGHTIKKSDSFDIPLLTRETVEHGSPDRTRDEYQLQQPPLG